ncbi:MafI family immunity protein [Agromyces sp. MMS24-JH15]|uniref:MafI family immunity protein n=1 Tax=Agromyces sp. MMS24-JH15 TaxID=3243765 RepID=UPI003747931C
MTHEELERTIREIADEFSGRLPDQDIDNAHIFLDAGELEIALENLCAQVYEYDLPVTVRTFKRIRSAGSELGLRSSHWTDLTVISNE